MFQANPAAVRLSVLTTDPVLQRLFRQIEDDGADEVVPVGPPRNPSHGGRAASPIEEFARI